MRRLTGPFSRSNNKQSLDDDFPPLGYEGIMSLTVKAAGGCKPNIVWNTCGQPPSPNRVVCCCRGNKTTTKQPSSSRSVGSLHSRPQKPLLHHIPLVKPRVLRNSTVAVFATFRTDARSSVSSTDSSKKVQTATHLYIVLFENIITAKETFF